MALPPCFKHRDMLFFFVFKLYVTTKSSGEQADAACSPLLFLLWMRRLIPAFPPGPQPLSAPRRAAASSGR